MNTRDLLLALTLLVSWPCHAEWTYTTVVGDGGVPLNVVSVGDPDNQAILFIHGLGQSHYSFVHQLNSELAEDFYLVAFDLRGHGESGKPWNAEAYTTSSAWARDVDAVLTATGAIQPIVVAWSYGSFVFMDYVREYGFSSVAAVNFSGALGGIVPLRMPALDDAEAARFAKLRQLQMSPNYADKLEAADGMVDWLTAGTISEPYRQLFVSAGFAVPAYARQHMFGRGLDNQDLLKELQLPVLLSMGSEDNPAMLADAEMLNSQHDNFSLSIFSGSGHSVFFEEPQRFNGELREFASAALSLNR